jgi:hypothetical protein
MSQMTKQQLKTQTSAIAKTNSKIERPSSLVLLFPIALCLGLIVYAWRWLIVFGVLSALGGLWKYYEQKQQERQEWLNVIFYQTLQKHQGKITTLDLAIAANITGVEAQEFLQQRAQEFGAEFDITDAGGILYCFTSITMSQSQSQAENNNSGNNESWGFRESESLKNTPKQLPAQSSASRLSPVNQSQLAERLGVHSTTISKNKTKPDFISWTRKKDPAGVAWTYSPETKEFFPLISK